MNIEYRLVGVNVKGENGNMVVNLILTNEQASDLILRALSERTADIVFRGLGAFEEGAVPVEEKSPAEVWAGRKAPEKKTGKEKPTTECPECGRRYGHNASCSMSLHARKKSVELADESIDAFHKSRSISPEKRKIVESMLRDGTSVADVARLALPDMDSKKRYNAVYTISNLIKKAIDEEGAIPA
jgi:hypothetical protein